MAQLLSNLVPLVDGLEQLLEDLKGLVDGLEGSATASGTKLDTLHADLAAVLAAVDGLEGSTDGLETKLDTLHTDLVSLSGLVDGLEGFSDGLEGLLTTIRDRLASPVSVENSTVDRGYQQLTSTAASATIASLCSGAALPTGATKVLVVPSAAVRFRSDGNPTSSVGLPVAASQPYTYDGDSISTLKVYGAATLDCWFYS